VNAQVDDATEVVINQLDDALCLAEIRGAKLTAICATDLLAGIKDHRAAASALREVADFLGEYEAIRETDAA
jgi:hypothetical protein